MGVLDFWRRKSVGGVGSFGSGSGVGGGGCIGSSVGFGGFGGGGGGSGAGVGLGGSAGSGAAAGGSLGAGGLSPKDALFYSVVNSINNLCNSEATFSLSPLEPCAELLLPFCSKLRDERFRITSALLRFGCCFLFPFFDSAGKLSFLIAANDSVRNLAFRDGALCDISLVCDALPLYHGGRALLLRRHFLDENGDLTVAYSATFEGVAGVGSVRSMRSDRSMRSWGRSGGAERSAAGRGVGSGGVGVGSGGVGVGSGGVGVGSGGVGVGSGGVGVGSGRVGVGSGVYGGGDVGGLWDGIVGSSFTVRRAFSLGVGVFNSPKDNPDVAIPLGVPLNFGCDAAENRILRDLQLIQSEFENGKSLIFADPRILLNCDSSFKIADNIFPVSSPAGRNAPNIDVFNPTLRHEAYAAKLQQDFLLYEKQLGVSAGLLSRSDASCAATATAVKRANSDTCALLARLRDSLDLGNLSTLRALGLFLRVPNSAWRYSSDWFDPFEDPSEQWARLVSAREAGAVSAAALTRWLFPNLSDEEVAGMCGE